MQHWTENAIKDRLDGTFTRTDTVTGQSRTVEVPRDYEPSHNVIGNSATGASCLGVQKAGYKHFSPAEDEIIIGLKAKGVPASQIAKLLGRMDDTSVNKRYRLLVKRGSARPVVA